MGVAGAVEGGRRASSVAGSARRGVAPRWEGRVLSFVTSSKFFLFFCYENLFFVCCFELFTCCYFFLLSVKIAFCVIFVSVV